MSHPTVRLDGVAAVEHRAVEPTETPGRLPVFSVVDIETSGLSTRRHRILQIAIARVDDGEIVDEWSSLVRLRWPWQRVGPRRVHGISRSRLRGAPDSASVLAEFAARTEGTVLVAHNMGFDWAFIERAARSYGVELTPRPRVCTLWMSRRLDPDRQQSHRLGDLCERYGITNDRPHDARFDARATALVLPKLLVDHGITDAVELEAFYER